MTGKASTSADDLATLAQAKAIFKHTEIEKFAEFIGCENKDEATFSCQQWMDLQSDFAMTIFDDDKYIELMEGAWDVSEPAHVKVS